jgi:hypothetical protein
MVVSADFEKEKQYFDHENIALSFYRNIARQNRPSDESLRVSNPKLTNPQVRVKVWNYWTRQKKHHGSEPLL